MIQSSQHIIRKPSDAPGKRSSQISRALEPKKPKPSR